MSTVDSRLIAARARRNARARAWREIMSSGAERVVALLLPQPLEEYCWTLLRTRAEGEERVKWCVMAADMTMATTTMAIVDSALRGGGNVTGMGASGDSGEESRLGAS